MDILIIGGTRLLGHAIVRHLVAAGHNVTVLSRRPEKCPEGAEAIGADRAAGLNLLSRRKFDVTVDFIAYEKKATAQVFSTIDFGFYIVISTTWLTRLAPGTEADQAVTSYDADYSNRLPGITFNYLVGKMHVEEAVIEMRKKNSNATVLRLPIFWGEEEHTGRVKFYCERVMDGHPVICVEGGRNLAQIAWVEDIARVFTMWIAGGFYSTRPIWEALPDVGVKVRDIIWHIATGIRKAPVLVDVSYEILSRELPEYLAEEPLWRETPLSLTANNMFAAVKSKSTPQSEWLRTLAKSICCSGNIGASKLRARENEFLGKFAIKSTGR